MAEKCGRVYDEEKDEERSRNSWRKGMVNANLHDYTRGTRPRSATGAFGTSFSVGGGLGEVERLRPWKRSLPSALGKSGTGSGYYLQ